MQTSQIAQVGLPNLIIALLLLTGRLTFSDVTLGLTGVTGICLEPTV